jgi:hypothetical protein
MEPYEQLMVKYAELLTGETDPQWVEQIKKWAIYSQIQRTMPALTSHWLSEFPEQKAEMRQLFEAVKSKNEAYREQHKTVES